MASINLFMHLNEVNTFIYAMQCNSMQQKFCRNDWILYFEKDAIQLNKYNL